ncbi:MAG: histidine phosphatase family protein [Proteobacteria bacterium]|nr:MAG: histidine phosphatase family protein [Pseudomonadota bacterium]
MDLVTKVDLLRHGECEGGEIFRGVTDVALSVRGRQQMGDTLAGIGNNWQQIVSSPLLRCQVFSAQLAAEIKVPLVVEKDFRELDFGDWEGRPIDEIWRTEKAMVAQFMRDPGAATPPGGESTSAAQARIAQAWHATIKRCAGQHVLVVIHGGTIRLLLALLLDMPLAAISRWAVPYACLTRLKIVHQGDELLPVIVAHGDQRDP